MVAPESFPDFRNSRSKSSVRQQLLKQFTVLTDAREQRESKAAADRRAAQLSSLTEEIRQLLVDAAYVELALAANRDLFDDALPLDFSEQAYQRLKRHKVPFAGAMKLAGVGLPRPRPDDPAYIRLRETKKDVLGRRFESIRSKLIAQLRALATLQQTGEVFGNHGQSLGKYDVQLFGSEAD